MPYRTNGDLPKKQTDQYSTHGKTAFREAFNSALSHYGDEGTAFAVAHHAAQQAQAVKVQAPRVRKPKL